MATTDLIQVLLVDDDEDDYILTCAHFNDLTNWKFKLIWCSTYEEAVYNLNNCRHDIYIFDYLLGSKTGIDLIEEAFRLNCQEPIILLTGKGDEQIALDALRLGAADYLIKSELESAILERSIRYALERTKVIKALRQSERRYRRIFEESKDMLFISDLEGNILDANDAASALTGFEDSQILQKNIFDFFYKEEFELLWDQVRNDSEAINEEVRLLTKDEQRKYVVFSASIETDQGFSYVQGRIHDVTLQRQTEREKLFSEKLAVTSRLVRMLAHEVRNPLTNVNLSAEQLESELEDEDLIFYIDIIKRNCNRINDLITQLLQSSRPNEFTLARNSLHKTLDDTLETAFDRLQLKKIQIEKSYEVEDISILLNVDMFKIAVLNLITNAIEAMDHAKGVLKITTRKQEQDVQVLISDNGTGISEDNMAKIFEPYFTGKKTGMGIGLASTLNIIQSHKGRIDVQSEEGTGTVFILSFPLDE